MDGAFDPRPQYKESDPAPEPVHFMPTPAQQSWGTIISIVIIVLMVLVGAFYSWGKRIAAERAAVEQIQQSSSTSP